MTILEQIENYPSDSVPGTFLREVGLVSKGEAIDAYLTRHYEVRPTSMRKMGRGYQTFFDKKTLLKALRRKLEEGASKGISPLKLFRVCGANPEKTTPIMGQALPDLSDMFERLGANPETKSPNPVSIPPQPQSVPDLFERFQRDFAATIDALHEDLGSQMEILSVILRHAMAGKGVNTLPETNQVQETNAKILKKMDAIATLAETILAWVKPNRESTERIERQIDQIAVYFENQKEVNKIIFKKLDAAHTGIKKLNDELGVCA